MSKNEKVVNGRFVYAGLREEVAKPLSERKAVVVGRGGVKRVPRRHMLDEKEAAGMRKVFRESGDFQNPYKRGIYHASIQALINLGVDKGHSYKAWKAEVQKVMRSMKDDEGTNAWVRFSEREPRNEATGKDVDGRLIQTMQVLQRITGNHPYGEKLRQLHACVDILVDTDNNKLPMYRLNTEFANYNVVKPTNQLVGARRGRKPKTETKVKKTEVEVKKEVKAKKVNSKGKKVVKKAVKKAKVDQVPAEVPAAIEVTPKEQAEPVMEKKEVVTSVKG
jgi:hypothetical protein